MLRHPTRGVLLRGKRGRRSPSVGAMVQLHRSVRPCTSLYCGRRSPRLILGCGRALDECAELFGPAGGCCAAVRLARFSTRGWRRAPQRRRAAAYGKCPGGVTCFLSTDQRELLRRNPWAKTSD
eukprot:scaffold87019_cov87-Phaeocystis_antarctica.AAC.2